MRHRGAPEGEFERLASDHAKWRRVAGNLFAAAELLWPSITSGMWEHSRKPGTAAGAVGLRLRGPFYVLVGLAVENLTKAIIIRRKLWLVP
jgi:hypothetical protein